MRLESSEAASGPDAASAMRLTDTAQACLRALECPHLESKVAAGTPIERRAHIATCDPTAVLRLAALTENGLVVFPQFRDDVLRLHGCRGVPLKLHLGARDKPMKLFGHQLRALRFLRGANSKFNSDPTRARGMCGTILMMRMGLGKTATALAHAMMCPRPACPGNVHGENGFPTLVVASKTVMTMWQLDGFEKFLEVDQVKVLYLHKDWMRADDIDRLDRATIVRYDFVVTTYDVVLTLSRRYPGTMTSVLEFGRAGVWGENPNSVKDVHVRTRPHADHPTWTGLKVLYGTPWELVIADESQRFANQKTKTFRAMMGLYGRYKLCLTGTPIRNYRTDLWSQFRWMGYNGVRKAQQWRPMYMGMHNLRERVLKIEYADTDIVMPPQVTERHAIEFSGVENCVYQFVLEKTQAALDLMLRRKLDFVCVLALFTRLRQVCIAPYLITSMSKRDNKPTAGASYTEEVLAELEADGPLWSVIKDRHGPAGIGSSKIQAILETIRAVPPGEKVLVFSMFTSVLDLVAGALDGPDPVATGPIDAAAPVIHRDLFDDDDDDEEASIPSGVSASAPASVSASAAIGYEQLDGDTKDRGGVMRHFKTNPDIKVLLITYGVGGEGLNLPEANHVICVEPWWCPSVPDQAKARAWRPGQTRTVYMHDLVVHKTIEDHILAICKSKTEMTASFLSNTSTLGESVTQASSRLNAAMLCRILRT